MDIRYFLSLRIDFIRQLYDTASAPYTERKKAITSGEEPFVPAYREDEEPLFFAEWVEADESLQVLAYSCVSMLAAALHLYLKTWVKESGIPISESLKKSAFKNHGWFTGYKAHFAQHFEISFEAGPVTLELLEAVILARNRIEHPQSITSHTTQYADGDLKKLRHPFFIDAHEAALFANEDEGDREWFIPPTLRVTREQLLAATTEVARFADWFETTIESSIYAKQTPTTPLQQATKS